MSRLEECGQCQLRHFDPKPKTKVKLLEYDNSVSGSECKLRVLKENNENASDKQKELIQYYHETLGHLNKNKTLEIMRQYHNWKNLKSDVYAYIDSCQFCAERKIGKPNNATKKKFYSNGTFEFICIDIMGPLPEYKGYCYILGIVDVFSRYVKLIPLKSITAKSIAESILKYWIAYFGCPKTLHYDNAPQLRSGIMEEFCKILNVRRSFSMPYYHQGNGIIERVFRVVQDMLYSTAKSLHRSWVNVLPLIEMGLHSSVRGETNLSPFEIVFAKIMNIFPYITYPISSDEIPKVTPNHLKILSEQLENVHKQLNSFENKAMKDVNKRRHNLKVGDKVMVKIEGKCGIDRARYFGPCRIKELLSFDNLMLEYNGKIITRNIRQVKKFMGNNRCFDNVEKKITKDSRYPKRGKKEIPEKKTTEDSRYPKRGKKEIQRYGFSERYNSKGGV